MKNTSRRSDDVLHTLGETSIFSTFSNPAGRVDRAQRERPEHRDRRVLPPGLAPGPGGVAAADTPVRLPAGQRAQIAGVVELGMMWSSVE